MALSEGCAIYSLGCGACAHEKVLDGREEEEEADEVMFDRSNPGAVARGEKDNQSRAVKVDGS